jgi:hypothetical protein
MGKGLWEKKHSLEAISPSFHLSFLYIVMAAVFFDAPIYYSKNQ